MASVRLFFGRRMRRMLLSVPLVVACNDPFDGGTPTETVIVAAGDSGRLAVLSGPGGRIVTRPGPVPPFQDAYALAPDGQTLWFTAFNSIPDRTLMTLDTRSLSITGSVPMAELEGWSQVSDLSLAGNLAAVFSPDGTKLLLADAIKSSVTGIALLDVATRTPVGFLGPLSVSVNGLAMTPPTGAFPAGRIFAIGTRTPGVFPRVDSLFVIDPATFAIVSALFVAPPAGDGFGSLFELQPAPDGDSLYLLGVGQLYLYDLTAHQIVAQAPAASRLGSIALAPDGSAVYVTDPGDRRDDPGSGLIRVFGPGLEPRPAIDLRSESIDGVPPVTEGIAVSPDGSHLYITSGTGSRGPLFGPQPRRVFIVDAATRALIRSVPLSDYGGGPVFVVP